MALRLKTPCALTRAVLCALVFAARPAPAAEGVWPAPLGPSADPAGPFAKVRLPDVSFKGDQPHGAALSLPSGKAVVCYLDGMLGNANKTKVFLCDVKEGSVRSRWSLDGAYYPFDFDSSGTRVLCRRDHLGTGKKDTAEIWTLAAGGTLTPARWVPYGDEPQGERDLIWAAFVGDGRLATFSSGSKLMVWDAARLKPLYSVAASPGFPAVSPNGRYVAFLRDTAVGLLDVDTGKVGGYIPLPKEVESAALAFRPDGQALVCVAKDTVVFVDPAAGRSRAVSIPGVKGHGLRPLPSVGWADDRLLFVNDYLVDPDIPVPVWNYMGGPWSRPAGGHVWFLATRGMTEVGLVAVRLPHPGAVKKIMAARGDSSSFLLKPDDAVRVDVARVPKEQQDVARQALEGILGAAEYRPAADARLVLDVVPGEERFEERTYTIYRFFTFGAPAGNDNGRQEKHRFRLQPVEVRLLRDGKVIWDTRSQVTPGPPPSVSLSGDETLADKLAPFSAIDYGMLRKVALPKFLQEQLGRGVTRMSLGHSSVGPDGIEEWSSRLDSVRERFQDRKDQLDSSKKAKPKRTKL